MAFSIEFLDEPLQYLGDDPSPPYAIGEITLGSFKETFAANLYTWSKNDYEAQWRQAIRHILSGNDRAALITYYVGPEVSYNLNWWPIYRVDDLVYFQEQLLFFENAPEPFVGLQEPFYLERQFNYVKDRQIFNEDGERLSEWSVSLTEIEAFASTMN